MRWMFAIAVLLSPFAAHAGDGLTGNDTGGIIQSTPETGAVYRDIAASHCARWNRSAFITSVHRAYGEYIGFHCIVLRRYDPRKMRLSWTWPEY